MRWFILPLMIGFAAFLSVLPALGQPPAAASSPAEPRLLLAHYMPWFEADPANRRWGWHWTMNHYHPDQNSGGRPEAASHYFPLIGLYDSGDADALECQVLLMKFAGIQGVLIDWNGKDDYLDYGSNHRHVLSLIPILKRAGLKYAVVYEDAAVRNMVGAKRLPESETVAHGQELMKWMQAHWFTDDAYLKQNGRPVFLVFGSGYYTTEQWKQIFSVLPEPVQFYTESHRREPAVGGFDWPQPGKGTDAGFQEMDRFYSEAEKWPEFIPAAFPRFHDIYEQAGVQKSWGTIEDRDGKTYAETLERALKSKAAIIQLATWNDWGEGTQIEPSVEFGYRDLETTQRLRKKYIPASSSYSAQDLRLPVELYLLKKKAGFDAKQRGKLDAISDLLFAGQCAKARSLLAGISKRR